MIIVFQNGIVRQLGHETIKRDGNMIYCKIDTGDLLVVGEYKSEDIALKVMNKFTSAIISGKQSFRFPSKHEGTYGADA